MVRLNVPWYGEVFTVSLKRHTFVPVRVRYSFKVFWLLNSLAAWNYDVRLLANSEIHPIVFVRDFCPFRLWSSDSWNLLGQSLWENRPDLVYVRVVALYKYSVVLVASSRSLIMMTRQILLNSINDGVDFDHMIKIHTVSATSYRLRIDFIKDTKV